ncbi:glycosyltransferase family 1 protein [Rathayibacter rathayi]|uniref:glycogen phosphorylase n=1 Tax=Rathayibacter rathayi TaxID=33887 RepID=A0ABD6W6D1_RATRA|nr:alpha-glucan family phosphorylase [Rathayibacter rathayi]AZZ48911.1 glycosyltransferase family 1 protein [Rathayibacter rathayi]MWV74009.1 alpha-glucan family phosphorylase [Rathayibacter rathayi NCPPB 2980 = VKM Ac-1601]PPF11710.1 glycosyltransferase family 1 protein [Rathayibacter rathayi]PPF46284.1 glycosyltransferase family 1 protein [Rathayibacter rathayi]PPF78345.1 glycosyltransferase family 1 protein [Rathayibacter rathayi]
MKAIRRFIVRSVLPPELSALGDLAGNLRWAWHEPTRRLFDRVDPALWRRGGADPTALLGAVSPERLAELAGDQGFVDEAWRLREELERYRSEPRWYQSLPESAPRAIAYFSPEFGIAAALPQYSGGLGILAGDHLKASSDLGVPLTGVGLFYRSGYFSQTLSADGWQLESYPPLDPDGLPLRVVRLADGSPARIVLALPAGRALYARVWRADVGRVTLLLLDTDIPENEDSLRSVTDRLYGGGGEHRLLQELLLGVGGVRALALWAEVSGSALPEVFHTNEGHAGFQGLERISGLIGAGLDFDQALQVVRASTVFTTHTPVPAGIDRFDRALIEEYFSTELLPGVQVEDVLALGAEPGDSGTAFNMAFMGLRLAQRANGVSTLHGEVSRSMFSSLWPGFETAEVPIGSVTNGVHAASWTDPILRSLAQERLGTDDTTRADWTSEALGDTELWAARRAMREQLVQDARRRAARSWQEQNPGGLPPAWLDELLDSDVLTIGFARRVPTYKRLTLMLHDPERLRALLTHPQHPIQIVIAGKSHPADEEGKRLIQRLVRFAQEPDVRRRIVFLPDYDIAMAQLLYPGTDVWLNNPLRPLEACGTSGMKAALNGSLNLSILDGWWNEYFDGENGWAIPSSDRALDPEDRDSLEADALYELLETEVVPRYYECDHEGIPRHWVRSIRHTLATLSPELSAERMVRQYVEALYAPAAEAGRAVAADHFEPAKELAAWKRRVRADWPGVAVASVESGGIDAVPQRGDRLAVRARVRLGELSPADVSVEVVYGTTAADGSLTEVRHHELVVVEESGAVVPADAVGRVTYAGEVTLDRSGSFGYTVRVVPRHPLLARSAELGLTATAH